MYVWAVVAPQFFLTGGKEFKFQNCQRASFETLSNEFNLQFHGCLSGLDSALFALCMDWIAFQI